MLWSGGCFSCERVEHEESLKSLFQGIIYLNKSYGYGVLKQVDQSSGKVLFG